MNRSGVVAMVVAVLALPAGAQAATVTMSGGLLHVDDTGAQTNTTTINYSGGAWVVKDTSTNPTAGSGCTAVGDTATCTTGGPVQAFVNDAGGANSYTMQAPYPSSMQGGTGVDVLTGGASSDALFGGDGNDTLDGGDGVDQLYGGGGADVFKGGTAAGTFTTAHYDSDGAGRAAGVFVTVDDVANDGGAEDGTGDDVRSTIDLVEGTSFADLLTGSSTSLVFLKGEGGNDRLTGGSAPVGTYLIGGPGDDTMIGGSGFDRVSYDYLTSAASVTATIDSGGTSGAGDTDTYSGSINEIDGTPGNDTLTGSSANDYLKGSGGDDTLSGLGGDDHLYGDSDQVFSSPASDKDTLTGGAGNDRLVGNEDNDTLRLDDTEVDSLGGGSDCDGALPSGASGGTADVVFEDGADTPAVNCESVNPSGGSTGGSTTTTPGTTTTTTPAPPPAPPPNVNLNVPSDGGFTNEQPTFSGTAGNGASDGATIEISVQRQLSPNNFDTPIVFSVPRSGTTFSGSYPGRLAEGTYIARAFQNRGQSNEGHSNVPTFRVDSTAPVVAITSPADGGSVGEPRPAIIGTTGNAPGDDGHLTVEIRQGGELKSRVLAGREGTAWSTRPDVDLSPGGTYTVKATLTDAVGHVGESRTTTFRYFLAPSNVSRPTFSGTGELGANMHVVGVGDWNGTFPLSYLVQWLRCADTVIAHCTPAQTATFGTDDIDYTVVSQDVGKRLLLAVTAVNPAGRATAYAATFTGVVPPPDQTTGGRNGAGAGNPNKLPPPIDHTPKKTSDVCQTSLYFGPIGVKGTCFKREGLTWVATGSVEVNGLHLETSGGAKVIIDPLNLRIAAKGNVKVVAGPASFGNVSVGPFTLYDGSFDWVMQPNISLPDAVGLATQIPGFGGVGNLPSLGKLSDLPGLGSLASLPRLPGLGLPDFSQVSAADLKALRIPSLDDVDRMQIPAFYLPIASLPAIGLDTGSAGGLFGLPVQGKLAMRMVDSGVQFDAALGLPQFGNISAAASFKVFNDGRIQLDEVKAHADEVNAGIVDLRPLDIHFNGAQELWEGSAGAYLPFPGAPGLSATASVLKGRLKRIGLGYDGNLAIGASGVFLSHIDFVLDNGPPQTFTSGISLSAGPKLGSLPPAVSFDGKFIYQAGDPAIFAITGAAKIVGKTLAEAGAEYHTNGYFHAFGNIGFHVGPKDAFGVSGHVDGAVTGSAFDMGATIKVDIPGASITGKGAVSSTGIAVCGNVGALAGGASYRWATNAFSFFSGCDLSSYHPLGVVTRAADGTRAFTVPAGLAQTAFAVHGSGAAPKVTVTGPDGASIATPADSIDAVRTDKFFLVQQPMDDTTYVLVAAPAGGRWTIAPQAGSAPVTSVDQSDPLPAVRVSAHVRGHGVKRRLTWSLRPIDGQVVRFFERSGSVDRQIEKTSAASGSVAFAPAYGTGGTRSIRAVVLQDGMVRSRRVVARYVAPKPVRLSASRRVRLRRHGNSLVVSWAPVSGAVRYRVTAIVNGGQHVLKAPAGHRRRTVIRRVFGDEPVRVSVAAVDGHGANGRRAHARLRGRHVSRPHIPGLPPRHRRS